VLRLNGQQRTDNLTCRHREGRDQVLTAQPPASNVEVLHHAATLPDSIRNTPPARVAPTAGSHRTFLPDRPAHPRRGRGYEVCRMSSTPDDRGREDGP